MVTMIFVNHLLFTQVEMETDKMEAITMSLKSQTLFEFLLLKEDLAPKIPIGEKQDGNDVIRNSLMI